MYGRGRFLFFFTTFSPGSNSGSLPFGFLGSSPPAFPYPSSFCACRPSPLVRELYFSTRRSLLLSAPVPTFLSELSFPFSFSLHPTFTAPKTLSYLRHPPPTPDAYRSNAGPPNRAFCPHSPQVLFFPLLPLLFLVSREKTCSLLFPPPLAYSPFPPAGFSPRFCLL